MLSQRYSARSSLPGQMYVLHTSFSWLTPSHSLPPWSGLGLSHFLSLVISPPPQVALQAVQSLQSLQLPLTVKWKGIAVSIIIAKLGKQYLFLTRTNLKTIPKSHHEFVVCRLIQHVDIGK